MVICEFEYQASITFKIKNIEDKLIIKNIIFIAFKNM